MYKMKDTVKQLQNIQWDPTQGLYFIAWRWDNFLQRTILIFGLEKHNNGENTVSAPSHWLPEASFFSDIYTQKSWLYYNYAGFKNDILKRAASVKMY